MGRAVLRFHPLSSSPPLLNLFPFQAARYQMLVMFLVAATTASATAAAVGLAATTLVDADARLRRDRLRPRAESRGWGQRAAHAAHDAWRRRRRRPADEEPLIGGGGG